jgi:DEAD/DEAH box helicase domain-containing protein
VTDRLILHEPRGFRTDFRPEDYSEPDSRGPAGSAPQLAIVTDGAEPRRVGAVLVRGHAERQIFEINDNGGHLFDLYHHRGTVLAPGLTRAGDAGPFTDLLDNQPDLKAAIASIRPTDVMVIEADQLRLPAGPRSLALDGCPAAIPAFWSLAELLRVAAADVLEIDANELEVGLQPWRTDHGLSRRLFIADRLDNGAGYSMRLATVALERALEHATSGIAEKWEAVRHLQCDTSCPDCLRNYENRRLHPNLDWRLALDMAHLALGHELPTARWQARSEVVAEALAAAFDLAVDEVEGLVALRHPETDRLAIFGHPLWSTREPEFAPQQHAALGAVTASSILTDPFIADRTPDAVARFLGGE